MLRSNRKRPRSLEGYNGSDSNKTAKLGEDTVSSNTVTDVTSSLPRKAPEVYHSQATTPNTGSEGTGDTVVPRPEHPFEVPIDKVTPESIDSGVSRAKPSLSADIAPIGLQEDQVGVITVLKEPQQCHSDVSTSKPHPADPAIPNAQQQLNDVAVLPQTHHEDPGDPEAPKALTDDADLAAQKSQLQCHPGTVIPKEHPEDFGVAEAPKALAGEDAHIAVAISSFGTDVTKSHPRLYPDATQSHNEPHKEQIPNVLGDTPNIGFTSVVVKEDYLVFTESQRPESVGTREGSQILNPSADNAVAIEMEESTTVDISPDNVASKYGSEKNNDDHQINGGQTNGQNGALPGGGRGIKRPPGFESSQEKKMKENNNEGIKKQHKMAVDDTQSSLANPQENNNSEKKLQENSLEDNGTSMRTESGGSSQTRESCGLSEVGVESFHPLQDESGRVVDVQSTVPRDGSTDTAGTRHQQNDQCPDQCPVENSKGPSDDEACHDADGKKGDGNIEGDHREETSEATDVPLATREDDISSSNEESEAEEPAGNAKKRKFLTKEHEKQRKKERRHKKKNKKGAKKTQPKGKQDKDVTDEYMPPSTPMEGNEKENAVNSKGNPETEKPKQPPQDHTQEDCVTVFFHALLSPKFDFNPDKHSVHLRFDHIELGHWEFNIVDCEVVSTLENKFVRLQAKALIPVRLVRLSHCAYKWIVNRNKERGKVGKEGYEFEFLEFKPDHKEVVDRDLVIDPEYIVKDAVWHQYDGVVYPQPTKSWLSFDSITSILGLRSGDEPIKNRQLAALEFIPKWKGFVVDANKAENVAVTQALDQMWMINECMSTVFVQQYGYRKKISLSGPFNFAEV